MKLVLKYLTIIVLVASIVAAAGYLIFSAWAPSVSGAKIPIFAGRVLPH